MRSLFVVILAPILQSFECIRKVQEPMDVQTLCFEPSVESLNERIVGGVARRGEIQRNAALVSP